MKIRIPHRFNRALPACVLGLLASLTPLGAQEPPTKDQKPPRLALRCSFEVDPRFQRPQFELSPAGTHLLISGREPSEHPSAGIETLRGLVVHELTKGTRVLQEPETPTGMGVPRFRADGAAVAWIAPGVDPETDPTIETRPRIEANTGTPAILHHVDLAEGTRSATPLPHRSLPGSIPELAALHSGASRVAFVEQTSRYDESLVVLDLGSGERLLADAEFREPYFSRGDDRIVYFHGEHILYHARPASESGGSGYRLRVRSLNPEFPDSELPGWVSNSTDRFLRLRSGGILNAGVDHRFELLDPHSGDRRFLFECRDELYSHFLETHLSGDEKILVAWSRERDVLVRCEIAAGGKTLHSIEEPDGLRSVYGLGPYGRYAYTRLRTWPENDKSRPGHDALVAFEFESNRVVSTILDPMPDEVHLSENGRVLVARSGSRVDVFDVE